MKAACSEGEAKRFHDRHMRLALEEYVRERDFRARVLHELPMRTHATRADLTIVDSAVIHAIEIKSDFDNLDRLEGQMAAYARHFPLISIATTKRHSRVVNAVIPDWCGIIEVTGDLECRVHRLPIWNPEVDTAYALSLLTDDELTHIVRVNALPARPPHRRSLVWRVLRGCSAAEICDLIRLSLFRRARARFDGGQPQNPLDICLDTNSMWCETPTAVQRELRAFTGTPAEQSAICAVPQSTSMASTRRRTSTMLHIS